MKTSPRSGFRLLLCLLAAGPAWAAAPVFQRSDAVGLTLGQDLDYRLVAIGDAISYTAQGLPNGVVIDGATGRIHGTPTDIGSYRVAVNATNADGTSAATLTVSVVAPDAAPLIYAPLVFDAYDTAQPGGDHFTCTLKATGAPNRYDCTDVLPAGWTFTSGSLVGSTTKPGMYTVPVNATNTYGVGSAAIAVRVHPACTGVEQTTGSLRAGDAFVVTLQFNRPVSFTGPAPYLEFHTYPDTGTKRLAYVSGNGTATYVFSYTVAPSDPAGDIMLYASIQPAAGSDVTGLVDQDGLALGSSLPIYGATTPAAKIVASAPATPAPAATASTSTATTASSIATSTTASSVASSSSSTTITTATPTTASASTGAVASAASSTAVTTTNQSAPGGRLVNLSARGMVSGGDSSQSFIAGFVVSGSAPKHMLVRAVGPALSSFGVQDALPDPQLLVRDAKGNVVGSSDNWTGASTASTGVHVGAFALPDGSRDAAVELTLSPGNYSMEVIPNGGKGVALAEIYDADTAATSSPLINISTRGYVTSGEGVLTAGFVVAGDAPKRLLIRGIGPALTSFGVSSALADPSVTIYHGNTVVAQNNDWQSDQVNATSADIAAAAKAAGAFDLANGSHDAATIVTLAPGTYTAVVSGANGSSGAAMVEVYEMPAP